MTTAKILVVDDEADILLLIRCILEDEGFEVATALNGAEALDMLKSETPDLMLLDAMMPEKSGFEVLETIHDSREPYMRIPIIMLSALRDASKTERAIEMGAAAFVSKPLDYPELLTKIRSLLEDSTEGAGPS